MTDYSNLTPNDVTIKANLNHDVQLWKLQAGDVLLCRPRSPLNESQTERLWHQLNTNLQGADVKILIVPCTWDMAVVSVESAPRDIVDGLVTMLKELNE